MEKMKKTAESAVSYALSCGAETAEVSVREELEFNVNIRNGEIENLTESVSSRILILVSSDKRRASVSTSDLSAESVRSMAEEAVELAKVMEQDEFFSLPAEEEMGSAGGGLGNFDMSIQKLPTADRIRLARELEGIARSMDKRIVTDQSSYASSVQKSVLANSLGFCEGYSSTYNSLALSCAAEDTTDASNRGKRQSAFWYSASTSFEGLDSIEKVASEAVSRTLRKLGSVKPKTCEVPVIFDPATSRTFIGFISEAVRGHNIYRRSSFLAGRLDQRIASDKFTLIDDPLMDGKIGSRPFDGEGVKSRKNLVVENGVLKTYLMNTYEGRKLGMNTTGSDGGISNFFMVPGGSSEDEMMSGVDKGLYLTGLSGQGANWSTGDFSQGAQGIWIENGRLSYPVSGFTIAGTFDSMLKSIESVGDNIEWKSSIASPSFKIGKIVISGA